MKRQDSLTSFNTWTGAAEGRRSKRWDGFPEWQAAGLPVERAVKE